MKTTLSIALLFCASSLAFSQWGPWTTTRTALPQGNFGVISIAPVDSNILWGAGWRYPNWISPYFGVVRTTDGGATWICDTIHGAPATWANASISAVDANTAWVLMFDLSGALSGGVFSTTNGGLNWTQQTTAFPGGGGFADFVYFFDASNGVCVGDPNGGYFEIYTTTNGGTNWHVYHRRTSRHHFLKRLRVSMHIVLSATLYGFPHTREGCIEQRIAG